MFGSVKCLSLPFLLTTVICFWTRHAQSQSSTPPEVTIIQGTLRGLIMTTHHQRNISGFLGIPYAQPPVGNLRFTNPVRADGWNGTRNASIDMNQCPQLLGSAVVGEEDCLYLNVYTPQLPGSTNSSLLPVMVYIHGGALSKGTARSDTLSPAYLLDEDIVLVTLNYRLGVLGFLSTGDEIASGNWALKDQVLALKWVQENVEYFGGDPEQVTLFGVSAGSATLHLLTLSNATIGLFHRYITQSGSAIATWSFQPRAAFARHAFVLGEYVGCSNDTSESLISCLRTLEFSDLIDTQSPFYVWQTHPSIVWSPTEEPDIEGAIITDRPSDLFANGKVRDQPWISGAVQDEGLIHSIAIYENEEMFDEFLEKMDDILPVMLNYQYQSDSGAAWVKAIKSYYFNDLTANKSLLFSNLTLLVGDALFLYPAYDAARQQLAVAENPLYFYIFSYQGSISKSLMQSTSSSNYGVAHGDDNIYLFPMTSLYSSYNISPSETDLEMIDTMVQLWTSFAINGTPIISTSNGSMTWTPFSTEDNFLRIGDASEVKLEMQLSYASDRMQFWTDFTTAGATGAAVHLHSNSFFIHILIYSLLVLSLAINIVRL